MEINHDDMFALRGLTTICCDLLSTPSQIRKSTKGNWWTNFRSSFGRLERRGWLEGSSRFPRTVALIGDAKHLRATVTSVSCLSLSLPLQHVRFRTYPERITAIKNSSRKGLDCSRFPQFVSSIEWKKGPCHHFSLNYDLRYDSRTDAISYIFFLRDFFCVDF